MAPDFLLTAWRFPSSVDTKSRLSGRETVALQNPYGNTTQQSSDHEYNSDISERACTSTHAAQGRSNMGTVNNDIIQRLLILTHTHT